jgi:aminopeptidase N
MKLKALLMVFLAVALTAVVSAQDVSIQDFHEAEYQMKAEHWRMMKDINDRDLILDQMDFDVKYWELDINVTNIAGQIISGKVTMTSQSVVDGLAQVDYDLNYAMTADSVFMNGQPVTFAHNSNTLAITLNQTYNNGDLFTTVVYYHGHPPGSGFGSFTWEEHNGQPIISTLSEPEGAREWWPCKDMPHDKADSADVLITVPDDLVATSNGLLISNTDNGNGTRTFHWHISYPITTYLICASISNYQSFTDWYVTTEGDSMPVTNYVYPELFDDAVEDLNIIPDVIGFYAGLFGEYPFINEKYGHSLFPWGGAMEHQCNTSYGDMLIRGDHAYDYIAVHELSHMWFGDMITCDIWPEIWMNEGFASYCEALWAEHNWGSEGLRSYMNSSNHVTDPSGPIYDPDELFSGNTVYNKGAWVLHMLRGVMGDMAFFAGIHAYATDPRYQYSTITTREFQAVMEEFYGASLGWYFDEWIWGMNRPFYAYSWIDEDLGNGQYEVFLHIEQTQPNPAPAVFTMPIKVYPRIGGIDTVITVFDDSRVDDFRFIVNGNPSVVRFDANDWILKTSYLANYGMNIVTTELPNGYEDTPYSATIESRGGTPPYQYTVIDGSLPPDLELDANTGELSGVPTTEGQFAFTVRSTDSSTQPKIDDQDYDLMIERQIGIDDNAGVMPSRFELIGNYPNPFNNSTVISFRLAQAAQVSLNVYNVLGQQVAELHSGYLAAGLHSFQWTGDTAPSGVYFYKLTAGANSEVKKMTLLK